MEIVDSLIKFFFLFISGYLGIKFFNLQKRTKELETRETLRTIRDKVNDTDLDQLIDENSELYGRYKPPGRGQKDH